MNNEKLIKTIRQIVTMLVQGDYIGLEKLTNSNGLNATEIAESIQQYGRTLVMPPVDILNILNIIEIEGARPRRWYVGVDLWTLEEGRSDLSLELTLEDSDEAMYKVEIDDIHVL